MSYTFVARSIDLRSPDLKARCVAAAGSPIIYADIHPISLPNHVANKHVHRAKVTPEAIDTHLAALFAHTALMDRVQVVLFSGLDGAVFQYGRDACMRACVAQALPVWSVPFFHGVNSRKLQAALTTDLRHAVGSVAQTFCTLEHQETHPHAGAKQRR